jgi:hypothetical protein
MGLWLTNRAEGRPRRWNCVLEEVECEADDHTRLHRTIDTARLTPREINDGDVENLGLDRGELANSLLLGRGVRCPHCHSLAVVPGNQGFRTNLDGHLGLDFGEEEWSGRGFEIPEVAQE